MLVRRDLGFPSLVFLVVVVVVPAIVLIIRRKWRQSVARSEEIKRLVVSASEELARAEFEARESYYYSAPATPSVRVSVSTPAAVPISASVPLGSPLKPPYQCAVCFCPTTTRCAKCKAVRYCSGKCQIIHWRQGHKYECRPFVAVSPINDVGGSSYRQADHQDQSDGFDTEAQETTSSSSRSPETSDHKDDVGPEPVAHQQGTNSTSESNEGHFPSSTPTKISAGTPPRKSTGSVKTNHKRSNPSNEDKSSKESSLSEPSTTTSGFWDGSISKKNSSTNEQDDFSPGSSTDASKGYKSNQTTKGVNTGNIMNGFSPDKVIGMGSKKSNVDTNLSKNMVNGGSKSRESKSSPSGVSSHHAPASAVHSMLKDHNSPSSIPARSNDVSSNKITMPSTSKSREEGSSSSSYKVPATNLTTFTSKHASHPTKPMKVAEDDNQRVTTSQLTENLRIRSGSKTSKSKVVDQVKPSKSSRQESLEGANETTHRYGFKGLFPYEMFVKLYVSKKVELQPCGLRNCGNSCYANAVLQCLIYTPPLTAYFLQGLHSRACDKRGWCFTCELEGLVMKAKDGVSPLSPIRILTHIENIGSNLGHGKEEDAHEFLRYVIDALQSVCIKEAGTSTLNSLEEETTLIGLTFGGYLRSKITCMKCGIKSEQHERMMDLTVEIEGNIRTLEEALDKFTCTEVLDGENKYNCSRCKSYEKARKKLTLLEAPNVLTIALKRFQYGKYGKLNKSISFPEILDMAPYVSGTSDKSPIYRLYGVVVHLDTMNDAFSGHYVCYVKNVENRWFMFNDSMVNEVDLHHVLTKGAYMLLYARCSPRAPRSIRNSLLHHKTTPPPSSFGMRSQSTTEPWEAPHTHRHRSLEEESSSSSDNSGFFSESCSCSTDSTLRDANGIEDHIPGDWEHDYWNNGVVVSSSDSDTSSTSSFPSPLYSRLSHLYNKGEVSKECRNLDCSCNSSCCRVTNLDRLGGNGNGNGKPGLTFKTWGKSN